MKIPGLTHGPIPELEAHGPMREYYFFLQKGPKPRLGPFLYMPGNTVVAIFRSKCIVKFRGNGQEILFQSGLWTSIW